VRALLLAGLLLMLASAPARAQELVSICHATGNPANPYVPLSLDNAGVLEHVNHEDDLVPAPAGGCPSQVVPEPTEVPTVTATPEYAVPTVAPTAAATPTSTPRPARTPRPKPHTDGGVGPAPPPRSAVLPTVTSTIPEQTATAAQDLPMTGGEVWPIALFGLGFLLTGAGLRLRHGS
jgi:hypothetical protein